MSLYQSSSLVLRPAVYASLRKTPVIVRTKNVAFTNTPQIRQRGYCKSRFMWKSESVVTPSPTTAAKSSGGIMSFPKENPFTFQMIVATGKTMAADLMVQMVAEGKSLEDVDWKRNGIFVLFGFVYLGGFQWYLMVHKYRQWFPTMDAFAKMSFAEKLRYPAGILDAVKMVIFDVTIHLPLMYFPTYYVVKEFVGGTTWNPMDWMYDGVTKYSKNMKEDLTAMIKLWGPSDCIQFVLPIHIRMPFRHAVSFFWTAYVSFTRGAIQKSNNTDNDNNDDINNNEMNPVGAVEQSTATTSESLKQ